MSRRWRFTPHHYPSRRLEDHVPTMRYPKCGKGMVHPTGEEVVFCSNCGASLHDELQARSLIHKGKEAKARKRTGTKAAGLGSCIVCNLVVSQQDNLTWCPHCGNPAHRDHLLEWIRRRNRCPVCGEHLDERELRG